MAMKKTLTLIATLFVSSTPGFAQTQPVVDGKPGSITCEECPYPYPSSYLPMTVYGQHVRMAFMDVAPAGTPNGHRSG